MTRATVVIGGGVVGLCVAHFMRRAGWDVTLVERDRVCGGVSAGNAGQISGVASPLPAPGIVATAFRNLYRRDSAFHIYPRAVTHYARFLLSMARKCNRTDFEWGSRALTRFSESTYALFDEMKGLVPGLEVVQGSYLYVCSSVEQSEQRMAAYCSQSDTSVSPVQGVFNSSELKEIEPCLGNGAQGGFLVENQAHVNPEQLCAALLSSLRRDGVQIVEGARVTRMVETAHGVDVHTTRGTFQASAAVVAAGVGSRAVAATLGVTLPIYGGKGYSFSIAPEVPPQRVLKLVNAYVGVVPMPGVGVRVAGTMELDADQDRFNWHRIAAIIEAAKPYLEGVDWGQRTREWMGNRPMTPDGLPIIGPISRRGRVWAATGHNMGGVALAPATGAAVAEALDGKTHPGPENPFRADRFGSRLVNTPTNTVSPVDGR